MDPANSERPLLKEEARRCSASSWPPILWEFFKFPQSPRTVVGNWNLIANSAQFFMSTAFFILRTVVGKGAKNKICNLSLLARWTFQTQDDVFLFWERRNESSAPLEIAPGDISSIEFPYGFKTRFLTNESLRRTGLPRGLYPKNSFFY
jgi:hypothetical protein